MKIPHILTPKLSLRNINSFTETKSFSKEDFFQPHPNQKSDFEIDFSIPELIDFLDNDPAVLEFFDYPMEDIVIPSFQEAGADFAHSYHPAEGVLAKFEGMTREEFSQNFVLSFIDKANRHISKTVLNKTGFNLEHFIQKKEQEKEDDLLLDYSNKINAMVRKRFLEKFGKEHYKILSQASDIDFMYCDTKQHPNYEIIRPQHPTNTYKLENFRKHNNALKEKNDPENIKQTNSILNNPYVEYIQYLQKNNYRSIHIITTEEFKRSILEIAEEETQRFYSNPTYGIQKGKFISRVNDGKGNDADVWLHNNELVLFNQNGMIKNKEHELFEKAQKQLEEYKLKKPQESNPNGSPSKPKKKRGL